MIKGISLTASMRSNLHSLKTIASQMDKTQNILSTGKKVNSAIDNASSYYQARSLTNRANDLNSLLDSMSQGIQTIQAATQGLESATAYLEQMQSIVSQALTTKPSGTTIEIPQGAKKITSGMTTDEMQAVLSQGGTIALTEDIVIDKTLILDSDVELIGNGKTITYAGSTQGDSALKITANAKISGLNINYSNSVAQGSAVTLDGATAKAEIDNITINATGYRVYGIQVWNDAELILDNTDNITVNGDYSHKLVNGNPDLWDGEYNTDMIIEQIGDEGIAATACKNYTPTAELADDENFGQGTWYLPGLGELCDLYGTNYDAITSGTNGDYTGAKGNIKGDINNTIKELKKHGVNAEELKENYPYSSSSEATGVYNYRLNMVNGARSVIGGGASMNVRASQSLENCFDNKGDSFIEIGDVVYSDMTYGKADKYEPSKTAVGVVYWVSEDKSSAKIIALNNLGLKQWASNNTDPETGVLYNETNIVAVKDYKGGDPIFNALTSGGEITVMNQKVEATYSADAGFQKQYAQVYDAFDELITDSSYQGVNLLTGGNLDVTFNETRTHELKVVGKDMRSDKIGLKTKEWNTNKDIEKSVQEIINAMNEIRNYSAELGNNYAIIQTRQNFTDALCSVLQTGADDLVLADMNEASAEYLMLQTRQQLAINSLSLASQSAQSILSLF